MKLKKMQIKWSSLYDYYLTFLSLYDYYLTLLFLYDDHNYHNWSRLMRRTLTSKDKSHVIDWTLITPFATDPNVELWDRANSMVVSWINRTLSPHIAQSTIYLGYAFGLWEDLREWFTNGNHLCFSDLLRDLHSVKQGDRSLSQYFTDLKIWWDELEDLRPTPSCSCAIPCTCDLTGVIRQYKHMEYVTCFLKGLSDSFNNIQTQILLLDPLPNISRVYSLIAQQEIHTPPASSIASIVLYANNPNSNGRGESRGPSKSTMMCTNCHKTNHTGDTCYFKHGFPPGYITNNNRQSFSTHVKSNNSSEKPPNISKEDYQHLLLLLKQSR